MVKEYNGHHPYAEASIFQAAPVATGVYYCGALLANGSLWPYYIGKGAGEHGIWGRLRSHFCESKWHDVTHFGFVECSSEWEALALETAEIKRFQPKYNTLGK